MAVDTSIWGAIKYNLLPQLKWNDQREVLRNMQNDPSLRTDLAVGPQQFEMNPEMFLEYYKRGGPREFGARAQEGVIKRQQNFDDIAAQMARQQQEQSYYKENMDLRDQEALTQQQPAIDALVAQRYAAADSSGASAARTNQLRGYDIEDQGFQREEFGWKREANEREKGLLAGPAINRLPEEKKIEALGTLYNSQSAVETLTDTLAWVENTSLADRTKFLGNDEAKAISNQFKMVMIPAAKEMMKLGTLSDGDISMIEDIIGDPASYLQTDSGRNALKALLQKMEDSNVQVHDVYLGEKPPPLKASSLAKALGGSKSENSEIRDRLVPYTGGGQ